MTTAAHLVAYGYLPRELPPAFTTGPLAEALEQSLPVQRADRECVRHNLARVNKQRRPLKIPNPQNFISLAEVIERNWEAIKAHVNRSPFSVSSPLVTRTSERAVRPRYRFGEKPKFRARDRSGQRFVLQADISQCYASIYTHSIPWALAGKEEAKRARDRAAGGDLDKALRAGSDGQTIGVPIGPDTSFIAAEIVLTAVDLLFAEADPQAKGFRYIDDYEFVFRSRSQAEEAHGHLEAVLAEYELTLNQAKTQVLELPEPLQEHWPHVILRFPIRRGTVRKGFNDLVALYSHASEIAKSSPGALKYALLRSKDVALDKDHWRTFQHLVWSAVAAEPTTTPAALDLLTLKAAEVAEPVDAATAVDALEGLIALHARVRNSSEVAWSLWAAIALELELSSECAGLVAAVDDDFVALLAMHAEESGRLPAGCLDRGHWEALVDEDRVFEGPHWMLAYEAATRGWLSTVDQRLREDDFFRLLSELNVSFFDPGIQRDPFTGPAGPLPGGIVPDHYA